MIYALYGLEDNLIKDFINKLINDNNIQNIIRYDLNDDLIESVIEDASYDDMFGDKKLIIVNNSSFLSDKDNIEILEKYLLNPNINNFLIFILNEEKINDKNNIIKIIREKCQLLEFNKIKGRELDKYIKNEFEKEDYAIDNESVRIIIELLSEDLSLIKNEIIKLKLYKIEEKEINVNDVKNVVSRLPEDNIFELVNAVVNRDKKTSFNIYKDLINRKEDEIKILGALASQIRLIYQVKALLESGYKKDEIASSLSIHPYRVQLAIVSSAKFTGENLLNLLYTLSEIDFNIKSGKIDKTQALESFFLEL